MTVGGAQRSHMADQTVSSPSAMRGEEGRERGGQQSARRLRSVGFSSLSQFSKACSKMRSARSPFFLKSRTATKRNPHTAEES